VAFAKGVLTIGFDPEFADKLGLVDHARNHTLLQTKLAELGHANAMVKFIQSERPIGYTFAKPVEVAPPVPPVAKPPAASPVEKPAPASAEKKSVPVAFNKDEFKNDPLIKKALEIFKGTIVEVRA